jgi:ribonuclease J
VGQVFELTAKTCRLSDETVPAGQVLVGGYGVGDVGAMVLRDRKHLAQDGMIVVAVNLSSHDGSVVTGPDIVTRGFIYVRESEDLMEALKYVVTDTLDRCREKRVRDHAALRSAIKNDLSAYLYKVTKRSPMIIPVVTEI